MAYVRDTPAPLARSLDSFQPRLRPQKRAYLPFNLRRSILLAVQDYDNVADLDAWEEQVDLCDSSRLDSSRLDSEASENEPNLEKPISNDSSGNSNNNNNEEEEGVDKQSPDIPPSEEAQELEELEGLIRTYNSERSIAAPN